MMKAPDHDESHGSGPDLSHNVDNDCSDHPRVPQLSFRKLAANPKITKVIPRSVSSTKHSKKYSASGSGVNQAMMAKFVEMRLVLNQRSIDNCETGQQEQQLSVQGNGTGT